MAERYAKITSQIAGLLAQGRRPLIARLPLLVWLPVGAPPQLVGWSKNRWIQGHGNLIAQYGYHRLIDLLAREGTESIREVQLQEPVVRVKQSATSEKGMQTGRSTFRSDAVLLSSQGGHHHGFDEARHGSGANLAPNGRDENGSHSLPSSCFRQHNQSMGVQQADFLR